MDTQLPHQLAQELRGAPAAKELTAQVAARAQAVLNAFGRKPTLALVRVGAREDDLAYERAALKRAEKCQVEVRVIELPATATQAELNAVMQQISGDSLIDGCLLFRPLPGQLDEAQAYSFLSAVKDVDGATQSSLLWSLAGVGEGFVPCTAEAVVRILDYYELPLEGANVCMVGRSLVIGKPAAMQLLARGASVDLCHSKTRNLAAHTRAADIVVVATGHPHTLTAQHVRAGQTIVDVGINEDAATGALIGDADTSAIAPLVFALTPVPGGVGALTAAILCDHVVCAAEKNLSMLSSSSQKGI